MDEETTQFYKFFKLAVLVFIAISLWTISQQNSSYFNDMYKASVAHLPERTDRFIGSGANEPPVFYNLGSVSQIDAALQQAANDPTDTFSDPKLNNLKKSRPYEGFTTPDQAHMDKLRGITTYERYAGSGL
jgi:hypothetical protein